MFTYDLDQEGVNNEATCVLKTEPSTEGRTVLTRACEDNRGYTDDGTVLVESETLEPMESTRAYFNVEDNETTEWSIIYGGQEASFEARQGDDSRTTTRELPEPTDESPDPGWYDDESLLWLVRGIDLREGFEGHYTHVINAGQPRVLTAKIEVEELEEVEVPAGTFMAWRVRVSSGNVVYRMWVTEGSEHWVVRAQVEGSTYELVSAD